MSKKYFITGLFLLGILCLATKQTHAASLTQLSDTVSTSRPSAASYVVNASPGLAAGSGDVIIDDNAAVFLASDSATLYADPNGGESGNTETINVASMSAANVPASNQRLVYFTGVTAHVHHTGDPVIVPITAVHTISFKPNTTIPVGGKIIITFPQMAASDTNPASPSASAFNLGGFVPSTTNIHANFSTGSSTCTFAVTGTGASGIPTVTCTVATAAINSGTTVTILLGCSSGASATCAAANQVPTIINPMRKQPPSANAGQGVSTTIADNWKIGVTTQDNNSVTLDNGTAVVGTIESVQVQAQIDPTLTFQISGIAGSTNLSSGHGAGCPSDITGTGLTSSATNVLLGTVNTTISLAAQDLTVSTNGTGGYALTATSSGALTDVAQGYAINSSTTPGIITAGNELFGIHPCGTDVNTGTWATGSVPGGSGKIAWPTQTTALGLASRVGTANNIITTIEYAITASSVTPAGFYTSIITYVATPVFN